MKHKTRNKMEISVVFFYKGGMYMYIKYTCVKCYYIIKE